MTHSDNLLLPPKIELKAVDDYVGGCDYDTRLTVFDGHGLKVGQAFGKITLGLPPGIYSVRAERLGEIGDDIVFLHEKDDEKEIPIPRRHSAMPSSDTANTHEFLQAAGYEFSRRATWDNPAAGPDDPLLMILVRSTGDGDQSGIRPAQSLALFKEDGTLVTRFEPDRVQGNTSEGWVVFSARLDPGNYILSHFEDTHAVSLPILLARKKFDTLVFVPYETRPRLSAASVDMCRRNEGYNPDDKFTQHIDAAIQGLGMRLDLLSDDLRREAIYGKFGHPFHGLIGAHAHFLGPKKSERLERQVLKNLWRLLEGSVDVIALLLLAQEREEGGMPKSIDDLNAAASRAFGTTLEGYLPLSFPPMLRSGLNSLVRASLDLPELIAPGSWLESAANSSYADGAWSVWDQDVASLVNKDAPALGVEAAPSRQKLYPAIKRAIARQIARSTNSITADDSLGDLLGGQTKSFPVILESIARDMPEFEIQLQPQIIDLRDQVRDLAHRLRRGSQPRTPEPQVMEPDTSIPSWLVAMVQDQMKSDGDDFDPKAVARAASVPLASVKRATDLVNRS
ncbi:hypothetical protein [Falsiphaeobacter marinintestinus]|uniref:hypothetical protein n=1 Tax=Falsiphaeobacter marinintestinus TaxID=1492905 RepID=UPI0011B36050|nr:hypothetical protein [Phaeobacter marinintestinus]